MKMGIEYIPDPSDLNAEGTLTYPFPRGVEVIVINDDGFGNIIYEKFTVNPESLNSSELHRLDPTNLSLFLLNVAKPVENQQLMSQSGILQSIHRKLHVHRRACFQWLLSAEVSGHPRLCDNHRH